MEKDVMGIINFAESIQLNENLIMKYVNCFVYENEVEKNLKELKNMLKALQTVNNQDSIKLLEKLFIQLLGHFNVVFFYLARYKESCSYLT